MPGYIRLTPLLHPSTAPYETGVSRVLTHTPDPVSFAVTPMTVPDGFDAFGGPSPGAPIPVVFGDTSPGKRLTRRPHAVILDKNPGVLEVLGQLLDEENYDVKLSTRFLDHDDGSHLRPDVIIADAALNRGPGGQCLYGKPLKRPDGTTIPIVYSTTVPEVATRLSGMALPILLKPFDLDTLLALLRQGDS